MKDINFGAFESLYDFYTAFPNEETCIAYLEKVLWPNGVVSPYDVSSKVYKRGDGYYRCKNCCIMKTKKDKHYIPILDQLIEELKKPIGDKVDFNAVMKKALSHNVKKKGSRK